MLPFVRPFRDQVMIVAVKEETLKVGDIVLFPGKYKGGDHCLHRLHRIDGDRVQTFGDGNLRPARWQKAFRLWGRLLPLRPVLLLPFRVMNKLRRLFPRFF